MAKVNRPSYMLFEVARLDRWRKFLTTLYGLELRPVPESPEHEALVDDAGSRLLFREGPAEDLVAVGWLADDLDGMHDRLAACGGQVSWMDPEYAARRGAGRVLQTEDPRRASRSTSWTGRLPPALSKRLTTVIGMSPATSASAT